MNSRCPILATGGWALGAWMGRIARFSFVLAGILLPVGTAPAQQLAFELETPDGKGIVIRQESGKLTAVCFLGTECPMARAYASRLSSLQAEFQDRGLRVVGIVSNRQDSDDDIRRYVEELEVAFPIVRDAGNRVADRYGATRTPEVFLVDAELKLRYHGRIDDQYAPGVAKQQPSRRDLRIAIEELLAGKPVSVRQTRALGCIIGKIKPPELEGDAPQGGITFSEHVSRVIQKHCLICHRSGEIGPFSMERYDEVVGWADTMMETIDDGRMPPWHADPEVGEFANARHMPESDKNVLRDWIAGGLIEGDKSQLPAPPTFIDGWHLPREPDAVFAMRERPFTVPKDGVVEYQYFVVDPGFQEDQWITAAQVVPGSRSVVHHAIVFVRPPDGSRFRGVGWLGAYVPGQRSAVLPPGRARRIPAGSKLVFQMHYTPTGVEQQDTTRVGLLFGDQSQITHEVYTIAALDQEFEIPPHAPDHRVTAKVRRLPQQGELLAITPHMHFRGKSFQLFQRGQGSDLLLNVPHYDFNWQHTYELKEPIPFGHLDSMSFLATFDNSAGNPFNPDPTQSVTWGDQTWEEMAVAFFEISEPLRQSEMATGREPVKAESAARRARVEAYVRRVLEKMDGDGDGRVKRSEAAIVVRQWNFWRWDLDQDGIATEEEIRRVAQRLYP